MSSHWLVWICLLSVAASVSFWKEATCTIKLNGLIFTSFNHSLLPTHFTAAQFWWLSNTESVSLSLSLSLAFSLILSLPPCLSPVGVNSTHGVGFPLNISGFTIYLYICDSAQARQSDRQIKIIYSLQITQIGKLLKLFKTHDFLSHFPATVLKSMISSFMSQLI